MRRIAAFTFLLLAVSVVAASANDVTADGHPDFSGSYTLGDIELDKSAKINFELLQLYDEYHEFISGPNTDGGFQASNPFLRVIGNRVIIEALSESNGNALKSDLEALGLRNGAKSSHTVSGQFPILGIKSLTRPTRSP